MTPKRAWIALAAVLVVAFAACDGGPSEPNAVDELGFRMDAEGNITLDQHHAGLFVPPLPMLLRRALREVASTDGREAARAMIQGLQELREDAHAARLAGDRNAFQEAHQALRAESARIIVEAFGSRPVDHALSAVADALALLEARIADAEAKGRDVSRVRARVAFITGLQDDARDALAGGETATALDRATRAAELLGLTRPPRQHRDEHRRRGHDR